jgi:predicted dehydrogenase
MPKRVWASCALGKRHHVEVEDDVTAFMEYANGATGVFVTSTGEAPGTNRLEIAGDRGKVVVEDGKVRFVRNEIATSEYSRTTRELFGRPPVWNAEIPVEGHGGQHAEVMQNFVDAILDGAPLIAPATEGIHSVELGNAMLLSGLTGKAVELPMDGAAFERRLKKLIRESTFVKKTAAEAGRVDMAKSF